MPAFPTKLPKTDRLMPSCKGRWSVSAILKNSHGLLVVCRFRKRANGRQILERAVEAQPEEDSRRQLHQAEASEEADEKLSSTITGLAAGFLGTGNDSVAKR
jgi:hypothetical protein